MSLFKIVRILVLLVILGVVAFYSKNQKLNARSWSKTLDVVIYPINADNGSSTVNDYIRGLNTEVFLPVDQFIEREAEPYELIAKQPTLTKLGGTVEALPPEAPPPSAGIPAIIWWGLKFRYWVFDNTPDSESNSHRIRVFALYHEAKDGRRLPHSLGLDKGLVAVVHAFASADQEAQNNIVIAHELMHTVGATDKYASDNSPSFPDGYADPELEPLYPQQAAEIMAGRIPLSQSEIRMADSLDECVVGEKTAQEINWISDEP